MEILEDKIKKFLAIGINYGSVYGDGDGDGNGYGSVYGDGSGDGYGSVYDIKEIHGSKVYMIDDVQTIITSVRGNVARGFILQSDLQLEPCYIVKENNKFATATPCEMPLRHFKRSCMMTARKKKE